MLSNGPFLKGRTKLVEFSVSSNFNSTTWDSTLNLDKVQTLSGATKVDTMGGGIFLQNLNIEIAENKSWILDIVISALQKMVRTSTTLDVSKQKSLYWWLLYHNNNMRFNYRKPELLVKGSTLCAPKWLWDPWNDVWLGEYGLITSVSFGGHKNDFGG